MTENRWLALIVGLFLLLGTLYAVTTPVFEASDELWHYPMVRHLADGNPLPVQVFDPAEAGPWKQEASQPPLYYYLSAALTFWIDTADMSLVRQENPHVDNGIITEDGNINLVIHDPAWNPWQGTLLAVRLVRLFSVLLSAGTVWLTYLIAREVLPGRPEIRLGAAAFVAFLPMFIFISGSVNNDNLAILLASLAIWLMIRIVNRVNDGRVSPSRSLWGYWLLVGIVVGLAILTKEGTFGLFPIALGAIFLTEWRRHRDEGGEETLLQPLLRSGGRTILGLVLFMVPVVLIAGWWYWRNVQLYDDFLGWNAFIAVLGQRAHPASLWQLWSERQGFLMSFWGLFGGVNVPMPMWIYTLLNALLLVATAGFVIFLARLLHDWWRSVRAGWRWRLTPILYRLFALATDHIGLVICLLFSFGVIVGLIQWATTTWSSQGRLVFTALATLAVLFVIGLVGWLPQRPARIVIGVLASFMFIVALLAPILWIRPSYEAPELAAPAGQTEATFGEAMRLVGYDVAADALQPGEPLWLTLEWEVLAPMARNWTIFVHLNDPVLERPIAQRDMYPGQGLLPTSLLAPGERLVTQHRVAVPATASAPADLSLALGFYDFQTCPACERLPLTDAGRLEAVGDALILEDVTLSAIPGETPNPVSVDFESGFTLVGYELSERRLRPGAPLELTTYWQLAAPVDADYTLFAQVVDDDTTRWAGVDVAQPTSLWPTEAVIPVTVPLTIDATTPSDVYPVIIGLYTLGDDGSFQRLQRITPDGRPTDDFLELTLLRVDAP